MDLPERIKTARKMAGLTQDALALKANLSKTAISQYESGRRGQGITGAIVRSLADALGVRREWLEFGEGAPDLDTAQPEAESIFAQGRRAFVQWVETKEPERAASLPLALTGGSRTHWQP